MHRKILIAFLLGSWSAATVFIWAMAAQNFRLVDKLLSSPAPQFQARISPLAPSDARLLMRYQASELNRLFFWRWGAVQLALGAILSLLLWKPPADRFLRIAALLMLLLAAVLQFLVVPETVRLGRLLDFAARSPAPPWEAPFWRLHHAYTALDMLKFLIGIAATGRMLRAGQVH